MDRPPTLSIRDRAAIVGIGQTVYTKVSGVTEERQAAEAIAAALADAGLTFADVDGVARFDIENVNELQLVHGMGIRTCASSPACPPPPATPPAQRR